MEHLVHLVINILFFISKKDNLALIDFYMYLLIANTKQNQFQHQGRARFKFKFD